MTCCSDQASRSCFVQCVGACLRLVAFATAIVLRSGCPTLAATYTWTAENDLWSSPANWSPQGVPGSGDTVNLMFTDSVNRTIIYDYAGPPVTLSELNVNLIRGYALSNPTAKLLILGNELSAVAEYVGKMGDYPDAPNGGGVIRQLGGINNVGSGGLWLGYELFGEGQYILSATLNSSGHEYVGYNGDGFFNQGGGTNTIATGHNLYLGVGPTAYGNYLLAGGILSVGQNVDVGSAAGGTGRLTVTANGVLTVAGTLTAYDTFQPYVDETEIELSGGTINTAALNLNGNPALLNWTSGTLHINSNVSFDSTAPGASTGGAFGASLALGTDQTLQITGYEILGDTGTFDLTVNNGGSHTLTDSIFLGMNPGSQATVTVNDGGTVATNGAMYVGGPWWQAGGQGTLNVNAGGTASLDQSLEVGNFSGSVGDVNVIGANATLEAGTFITVGGAGGGTLTVNNGGSVSAQTGFTIGSTSSAVGSATFNGSNTSLDLVSGAVVGFSGNGMLRIEDGATASVQHAFFLGYSATGVGSATVTGNDSSLEAIGDIYVGVDGEGTLIVDSGGVVTTPGSVFLATYANSEGTVEVVSGGTLAIGADAFVGGYWGAAGGQGVLSVNAGGTLNVTDTLAVWNTPGSSLNLNGGTINTAELNFNGNPALLNWTSGTLNINKNVTFDSSAAGTTTSAAFGASRTLGSEQTLQVTGNEKLGDAGTFDLTVNSGGSNTVTGDLTVNHTGSLTVNAGGTTTAQNAVYIGEHATLPTTVTVGGADASLQAAAIVVGNSGRGIMNVTGGGFAAAQNGIVIGSSTGSIGEATVSGAGSNLQAGFFRIGYNGQATLNVGDGGVAAATGFYYVGDNTGDGTLAITNGGTASTTGHMYVGRNAGSSGHVTVTGPNASIEALSVFVGRSGSGEMHISGGGNVTTGHFSVASDAGGGPGEVTIDGPTSSVTVQGVVGVNPLNITVGQYANGTLAMTNGATASAPVVSIGQYPTATGQATVGSGAHLHAAQFLNVGTGYNPLSVPPVDVGPNGGVGTLAINALSGASAGTQLITGNDGTVDLSGGGTMTVGNVGMAVPAAGSVLIGTGGAVKGTGTIVGAVVNDGGTVQPGFSPGLMHIAGDYTQASNGTLLIELGGSTTRGADYDALVATGQASLGGTLQVSLINSFDPALNDTFDILDASTMTGAFNMLNLPSLGDGLVWDTSQLDTMGVISIAASAGLDGDFNNDSRVDATDYVLWRKSGGTENEYGDWRTNFGDAQEGMGGTSSRSSSSAPAELAVPEPSFTALLVAVGSLLALPRAFRTSSSRLRLRFRSLAFLAIPMIGANTVHAETLGFIEFCVDCANHIETSGHAFVRLHPAWGPDRGTVLRLGFLPSTNDRFAAIALELPGKLVFELPNAHCDAMLIRSMSAKQYNDIINYLTINYLQPPPPLRPKYNLKSHNCTDFMAEIARKGHYDVPNLKNIFGISDPQEWCYDCFPLPPECGNGSPGCDVTQGTMMEASAQATSGDGGESPRNYSYTSLVRAGHSNAETVANITGLAYDPMYLGAFNANTVSGIDVNLTNADLAHSIVSIDWGDGSAFQDEATTFQHVYTDPGTYYAELFAMDSGAVHSYGMMVSVSAAPGSAVDVAITSFPPSTTPNPGLNPVESLTPVILGDFNDDGIADAADYVWWRKGLGSDYLPDDYDTWRTDFGRTYGEANASAAGMLSAENTVPEPASLLLTLVFLIRTVTGRQSRPQAPRLCLTRIATSQFERSGI